MFDIAAMSTAQLASLIESLRDDLERAKAAENFILVMDLRRAITNVTAALKERRSQKPAPILARRPITAVLAARGR